MYSVVVTKMTEGRTSLLDDIEGNGTTGAAAGSGPNGSGRNEIKLANQK